MRLFEHRLIDEERELTTRLGNLQKFCKTSAFEDLPQKDQDLLLQQEEAMTNYQFILRLRIDRFKDKP